MANFEAYSVGLCCASVCTNLPIETATEILNSKHPTGIQSQWKLSEDKAFRTGEENGCACPDHPGNQHWLFNC